MALISQILAAVPPMISYQGRVKVNGADFTGTGQFKFALVAEPGGTSLWSNDGSSVNGSEPAAAVVLPVKEGLFTLLLGDPTLAHMEPLGADLFPTHSAVTLRVWFDDGVNGSVQLSPDTRLVSVPYALAADIPAGSVTGTQLAPGAVEPDKLASANAPEAGRVLTYDGAQFHWADPGIAGNVWSVLNGNAYYNGGRIGVGTAQPAGGLHIAQGGLAVTGESSPYTGAGKGVFLESSPTYGAHVFAFDYDAFQGRPLLLNYPGGNVGIGTREPAAPLDVSAVWLTPGTTGVPNIRLSGPNPTLAWVESAFPSPPRYSWIAHLGGSGDLAFWHRLEEIGGTSPGEVVDTGWVPKVTITKEGGLRYAGELEKLETSERASATVRAADFNLGHSGRRGDPGRALVDGGSSLHLNFAGDWADTVLGGNRVILQAYDLLLGHALRRGSPGRALVDFGADLHLNFAGDWGTTIIGGATTVIQGDASVRSLTIRGGADLAEPFPMPAEIARGSVVVIDDERPGRLALSRRAYDTRVAGIVSGANGIQPGIALHQEGVLEGGLNVALSGRVYALADASTGAIRPGDLLTTSATPGHAMRAADPTEAQGAILGKAMSGLAEGRGMVLVLVSLQ